MDTWIASDDNPETVNIRDDGAEPEDSTDALAALEARIAEFKAAATPADIETARQGLLLAAEAPLGTGARAAWPLKHYSTIRAFTSGDDVANFALWAQYAYDWRVKEQGEQAAAQMLRFDAGVAVVAVMLVRVTGKMFTDKATGAVLEVPPTATGKDEKAAALARIAAVRRLPQAVINYIAGEINRRLVADPLGLTGTSGGSAKLAS